MKNDPIEAALAELATLRVDTPEGQKQLRKALAAKSNLVVARAARIAADALPTNFTADLANAFDRFLSRGSDKGCAALIAVARALVKLEYDDAGLFRRGMTYIQMEPVWGGREDSAPELRACCALGLANTQDPHKLRDLVELLVDREWPARAGAVRAIAATGSEAAALLLRYKALEGDSEMEVLAQCLSGLIEIEGGAALPLMRKLMESDGRQAREAATFALGGSRRHDAIEILKAKFDETADRERKKCILLALAGSRTEEALQFLLGLIRNESLAVAALAETAMSVLGGDPALQASVREAMEMRGR